MHSSSIATFLAAAAALTSTASAAFNAKAKTNVVTYWGQGANQDRLLVTCQNPAYDIINIGFVDVFPDQGPGGWPGTNFGNACWGDVYQNQNGVNTTLLKTCPNIGPDVIACQQTYGKKIFLSIGGGSPNNYYIKNAVSGQKFAQFLWSAFGPASASKANIPRPWGDAGVDGFDFDIENLMDPAPQKNYQSSGYAAMINQFKNKLFPQDTTKSYYISGAPQCPIPDSHLSIALASAWFDFFWIQFYNTPQCSARAAIQKAAGKGTNDISYGTWTTQKSLNPNVKMFIGLPGSPTAAIAKTYFLQPSEAQTLVNRFYGNAKFGGLMVWEATAAQNQTFCGQGYGTWMKSILTAKAAGKTFNTNTQTCAAFPSKRSVDDVPLHRRRGDYIVSYGTETATHVHGGATAYETHEATHTIFPTMPSGYYIPSASSEASPSSSSAQWPASYSSSSPSSPSYSSSIPWYDSVPWSDSSSSSSSSSSPSSSTAAAASSSIPSVPSEPVGTGGYGTTWATPTPTASPLSTSGNTWATSTGSSASATTSAPIMPATGDAAQRRSGVASIVAAFALALVFA